MKNTIPFIRNEETVFSFKKKSIVEEIWKEIFTIDWGKISRDMSYANFHLLFFMKL